jgi:predicted MFS family arabinose efflux permease
MWAGACTSSIGTWMQKLAQSWLVLQISGSAFLLGVDAFLGEIPIFLFSLVGGVVADRYDRRRLLIGSQVVQMSCAFLLTVLIAPGAVRVWHILALSFVVGFAQAFGGPAYQALLPTLVEPRHLSNAIALNSIQYNLARIIGPVIGGLTLANLGAAWCFGLNGASFLAVIASLLFVKTRFVPATSGESIMAGLRQGLGYIHQRPALRPLIALAFAMTVLAMPLVTFLPVFARDVFHQGAGAFTVLLATSGAGSVAGAVAVAALGHTPRQGRLALVSLSSFGALMAAFAVSRWLPVSCVALFFAGAAMMAVFALLTSLVQSLVTDELRGRVMRVYNVAFRGGMPIGNLIAGGLIPVLSAPSVLAANGAAILLAGLYLLFVHRRIASL